MRLAKRTVAAMLTAAMTTGMLGGCYAKLKEDAYPTTVIATFGDQEIMLDEVNYYLKLYQQQYDYYYQYLGASYGYTNIKDFYNDVPEDSAKSLWDNVKEAAMRSIYQTYVLNSVADQYNVKLTDDDMKKVDAAVKEFMEDDPGVIKAVKITEEHLKELYTRNAIAQRVRDELVKDIDTTVNEADYRFNGISYLSVTKQTDVKEDVDIKAMGEKVLGEWKEAVAKLEDGKDFNDAAKKIEEKYKDDKQIRVTLTQNRNMGKPADPEEGEEKKENLSTYVWDNCKKGEFTSYQDSSTYYAIYCSDDDVEEAKKEAIEAELEERREKKFTEKYPDVQKAAPGFAVKEKLYAQVEYEAMKYENTEAETTEAPTTKSEETKADGETTAAETTAAETTAEVTTAEETTAE